MAIESLHGKYDLLFGGLAMASGIYGWAYHHFHPEKLSPKITYKQFRLLCMLMIIGGIMVLLGAIMSS